MDDVILEANFIEKENSNNKQYYTLEEVIEVLEIEDSQILFWCNKFDDLLKIQSVGMHQIFDRNDVENLKMIKKLSIDGQMNTKEIKDYIEQHKNEVILKRETNISEKSLVDLFVKFLNTQNEKINYIAESQEALIKNNQKIIDSQQEFMEMFSDFRNEISLYNKNSQKAIEDANTQREKELKEKKKEIKAVNSLKKEIKSFNELTMKEIEGVKITNDLTFKEIEDLKASSKESEEKSIEMINLMKQNMEQREQEAQKLEEQKNKGFMSKLFGK